jgi:hypothetical protein
MRGDVASVAERFRVLVRSIGIVVLVVNPTTVRVVCDTHDDRKRFLRRARAARDVLGIREAALRRDGFTFVLEFSQ